MGFLKIFGFSSCFGSHHDSFPNEKIQSHIAVKPAQKSFRENVISTDNKPSDASRSMQTECQVHAHLAPPSAPSNVNAIKEKKRESFSTLTAWRILAGDIISRSGTAANNEEQPSVPLLPEQSVLTNHSFPEGWNEGTLEGNYELLDELGRGAFGRVVRARRKKDGAPACVKIISGSLQLGEKEREMVRNT